MHSTELRLAASPFSRARNQAIFSRTFCRSRLKAAASLADVRSHKLRIVHNITNIIIIHVIITNEIILFHFETRRHADGHDPDGAGQALAADGALPQGRRRVALFV